MTVRAHEVIYDYNRRIELPARRSLPRHPCSDVHAYARVSIATVASTRMAQSLMMEVPRQWRALRERGNA
jgi:hypothetical protein